MRAHFLRGVTFTQSLLPSGSGIQHTVHHASCRVAVPLLPVRPGILNSAILRFSCPGAARARVGFAGRLRRGYFHAYTHLTRRGARFQWRGEAQRPTAGPRETS